MLLLLAAPVHAAIELDALFLLVFVLLPILARLLDWVVKALTRGRGAVQRPASSAQAQARVEAEVEGEGEGEPALDGREIWRRLLSGEALEAPPEPEPARAPEPPAVLAALPVQSSVHAEPLARPWAPGAVAGLPPREMPSPGPKKRRARPGGTNWRRALVLREVLSAPVALRQAGEGPLAWRG